jgi:Uma2 family endonuclease
MNEILRQPFPGQPLSGWPKPPASTQAADGLPRRAWTGEEVQRMIDAGIVRHGERFELIGGELVAMAAKGNHHETLKTSLNYFWIKQAPRELMIGCETPLRLETYNEPEPEFIVYPRGMKPGEVRAETVLLVVEVADTGLPIDHNVNAPLYARFGVREYWVINARTLVTKIYRKPSPSGYAWKREFSGDELLSPMLAPSLAVRLADLDHE